MDTPADNSSHEESRVYALIGGSGGIGAAVAERLARRGARLLLAARDEERLAGVARPLEAETFVLDATRPEEVACVIEWLLGPEASWVTGQVIGIDGGLARVRPRGGR